MTGQSRIRGRLGRPLEPSRLITHPCHPRPATRKVVVAAAIDGDATFGNVGAIQIAAAPSSWNFAGTSTTPAAKAAGDYVVDLGF